LPSIDTSWFFNEGISMDPQNKNDRAAWLQEPSAAWSMRAQAPLLNQRLGA
jgi:hypothetical protein